MKSRITYPVAVRVFAYAVGITAAVLILIFLAG